MKTARNEQTFKKLEKTAKNLLIKIQTPNPAVHDLRYDSHRVVNVHNILQNEVDQVRKRIIRSKLLLEGSKRQEKNRQKLVQTDRMGVVLNHSDSNKKAQVGKLKLEMVTERGDETQRESEGDIQLPLHLERSINESGFISSRNNLSGLESDLDSFSHRSIERKDNSLGLEELNHSKLLKKTHYTTKGLLDNNETKETQYLQNFYKPMYKGVYKQTVGRSKELIKSKERFKQSLEKQSLKFRPETHFLNHSHQRLPRYMLAERSLSKERKKVRIGQNYQNSKIKIKLNKPNISQLQKNSQAHSSKIRPRYHIQIPKVTIEEDVYDVDDKEQVSVRNDLTDWKELRQKLSKYQFVRKYLTESDLFSIYDYLKKNHINQEKWPLFVVDQAYKKMNLAKTK